MAEAPRAVLDTNLIVRVLITPRSVTGRLLSALLERAYQLVTSEPLLEAGADYVVTDDRRDLLPLKQIHIAGFKPVQIVRPTGFLRLLGYDVA